jgi:hypothetical protein
MGKLVKNIILFLIPILLIIVLLPVNKRFMFQGLKDDCSNIGIWVHDRIFNNPRDIDIAFLGSSRTMNSINDGLISDRLAGREAVNFGYCRFGRDLHFILLKEIIRERNLKNLVIEVRDNENRFSHPVFPYIAQSRDVILANPIYNADLLSNVWTHFAYKIELVQDLIYMHDSAVPIRTGDFGFAPVEGTASTSKLDEIKKMRSIPKPEVMKIVQDFHACFARVYLEKISKICSERNIDIYFLYLPSYGSNIGKPKEYDTYLKYGEVLFPPNDIFDNQNNWYDENHLNKIGSKELSIWIVNQIKLKWKQQGIKQTG